MNADPLLAAYDRGDAADKYRFITGQHGSFWRYDFVDHALTYNCHFPPPELLAEMTAELPELLRSYPLAHRELATLMGRWIGRDAEHLVLGNGTCELIKVLAGLGENLIVPVPSFNEYENATPPEHLVRFALAPPHFDLDVDAFAETAAAAGGFAVVVNPGNPTSRAVAREHLLGLVDRLAGTGTTLIVDESFVDFAAPGASLEPEVERHPHLAVLKSLGKTCGAGGLRLGYLLTAGGELRARLLERLPIWNVNGFAEGFLRLLPRYRKQFAESCEQVRRDRDHLYAGLRRLAGLEPLRPDANFVLCRLPDGMVAAEALARELFVRHRVLIKPCGGKTMPEGDRWIRVSARTAPENRGLLEALEEVWTRLAPEGA